MARGKKVEEQGIRITKLERGRLTMGIIGESPLILNRMSEKALREILQPKQQENKAEQQARPKHNPIAEFEAAPHRIPDESSPTYLGFPGGGIKKAMETAALDTPGVKKAQVERLVHVASGLSRNLVPIYGVPELFMAATRNSDPGRTPDVRTRAILPRWAAVVEVVFTVPTLKPEDAANLLSNAGTTVGLGDWRPEKGGSYGTFRVVSLDDPDLQFLMQSQGREAQVAAMENPVPHDEESVELLSWWDVEVTRRGLKRMIASS